jgi:hypothetical protein
LLRPREPQPGSNLNFAELRQRKKALQLQQVRLPQIVRPHDPASQFPVVGEQQQTGAGIFQPADRKHARRNCFQVAGQRLPLLRIAHRRHHFRRLVHRQIQRFGGYRRQQLAIHFDVITRSIRFGAQLGHHFAV